jgi:glycosyltransferase involved in cell wall biosynthesis
MKLLLVGAKHSLAEALAAGGQLEVALVSPCSRRRSAAPSLAGVDTRLYSGGQKLNLRAAWQLGRIVREWQPDIVHAYYGRALAHILLAARRMRSGPAIVSFRGITARLSAFNVGDWLTYRHALVTAHACESAAVCEALVASGIDAARCWVTYNSMARPPASRPGRLGLAQFGIPANAFVVGIVATMRRVKGADLLLRAAIECAELSDIYWILFGKVVDPEVERLAADPRIRQRVRLVGHRPDAAELISGADVFCMPSRAEALCQALLEAMHQGVCPVVSNAGGMKEAVRDGQDGLVVPAEDVLALADAIRRLHGNRQLVTRLAASARQREADEFTPQKVAERCLEMYRHVVREREYCGAA